MRIFSFLLLVMAYSLAAQELKPVSSVAAGAGEVVIPFQKFVLPNGLTVILHEDHSDPLVHVDVTYHVGSAREEIGRSGFAHFFEHMMFQGSDHVQDDQHFKIVTESGGTLNGTTNRDRTNYFETVPSNQLERMLWLEADRMGFFLDAVTQKKFENQRATVKNERGQRYDNRPYGLVGEVTMKNLYPPGHPYSWLTIGYIEDLNRADLIDLKNFFLRWYGPNNATLTIGGDIDQTKTLQWIQKYFGSIPRGGEVDKAATKTASIEKDRFVTLVDNYAALPQVSITFPSIPLYHPDMHALDCLAEILGSGKASLFFQRLVKTRKAVSASANNAVFELGGEFTITAMPLGEVTLKELHGHIQNVLDSFEIRGVTDDDLAKYKGSYEAQLLNGLQSVSGKVSQLATFETFTGNPNMIGEMLRRARALTKDDILRVFRTYIKNKASVVVSVVTKKDSGKVVREQDYTVNPIPVPKREDQPLTYQKGKDSFDRRLMPGPGSNPELKMPSFWRERWPKGIDIISTTNSELPLVSFTISFLGGHLAQAGDTTKLGLSRMLALMLNEDTKVRTVEQMQIELQKLGALITVTTSTDRIHFNVSALKRNLGATVRLLEERILRPQFTDEALQRHRTQTLENFKLRNAQASTVADKVFSSLIFGKGHILGLEQLGTPATVSRVTMGDVNECYRTTIRSGNVQVVCAGDVTRHEFLNHLGFLKKLPDGPSRVFTVGPTPEIAASTIFVVDIPDAAQSEIRIGQRTRMTYDATGDFYKAGLMNYILGGSFSSRFNLNLREDKGWTYASRSLFSADRYAGTYLAYAPVKLEATDSALVEMIKEIKLYKSKGISLEEHEFMKQSIGQREALRYETLAQKASFIRLINEYNLPPDFLQQQRQILKGITMEEIQKLAQRWLTEEKMNIIVVGSKEKILPGLRRLNFPIVELDREGNRNGEVEN